MSERILPDDAVAFLAELTAAPGPSGFEAPVQRTWAARLRPVADEIATDAYGNTWAVVTPPNADIETPTVVVAGHADEIGLMVNHVDERGLLRVVPIGGVDPAILPGRRVRIHTPEGPIPGVIGAVPIHLQEKRGERKAPKIEQLFLDCGFTSAEEARGRVPIGTPVTLAADFERLGPRFVVSRALDNRIGIFAAAEVLRRVAARRDELRVRLVALSTIQEEIGAIGALMVTRTIDPDLAFVVDVTHATDVPGIDQAKHGRVELGAGPTVTHGTSNHPALVRRLVAVAERHRLPLQHEASSRFTGTDTDTIYRATRGIPAALVSLPNRYMHTPAELIDLGDLEVLVTLLTETILDLAPDERFVAVELP